MLNQIDNKKNPFKVPDNYLENLTAKVMDNLPTEDATPIKKVSLYKKIIPWMVSATIAGVVAFSSIVFLDLPTLLVTEKVQQSQSNTIYDSDRGLVQVDAEDFYLFIEDEATDEMYSEFLYNN